jgi:hypothetical protein
MRTTASEPLRGIARGRSDKVGMTVSNGGSALAWQIEGEIWERGKVDIDGTERCVCTWVIWLSVAWTVDIAGFWCLFFWLFSRDRIFF